jgi:hypothetical protein
MSGSYSSDVSYWANAIAGNDTSSGYEPAGYDKYGNPLTPGAPVYGSNTGTNTGGGQSSSGGGGGGSQMGGGSGGGSSSNPLSAIASALSHLFNPTATTPAVTATGAPVSAATTLQSMLPTLLIVGVIIFVVTKRK